MAARISMTGEGGCLITATLSHNSIAARRIEVSSSLPPHHHQHFHHDFYHNHHAISPLQHTPPQRCQPQHALNLVFGTVGQWLCLPRCISLSYYSAAVRRIILLILFALVAAFPITTLFFHSPPHAAATSTLALLILHQLLLPLLLQGIAARAQKRQIHRCISYCRSCEGYSTENRHLVLLHIYDTLIKLKKKINM